MTAGVHAADQPVSVLNHDDDRGLLRCHATVLGMLVSGAPMSEVLTTVVVTLEELIPASHCSVLLLDSASGTLRHGAAPGLPPEYSAAIDGMRIAADAGSCGTAAYLDAEIVATDIVSDPRWDRYRDLALPHGLRSCWSRPIRGRAAILGTFAVYHPGPHVPTPRERRLVERLTHLVSVAIEQAALYEALAEREERLTMALRAHQQDSRAGSALLTTLSHELRTPLQAITGFTELLTTLELPAERRAAALGYIGGAAAHILSLVDDALDLGTIEAGAVSVQLRAVDLGPLVAEVLGLLQPLADERGIDLRGPDPAGLPDGVRADSRRLRQVLLNLVSNAVRYNRSGGWVEITVHPLDASLADGRTVIRVRDSGPGVAPEAVDRLFVPFDRLGADAGPEPGAGLGLVLSRGLTEAMQGQLMIHSPAGGGTTAEVWLPAA